MACEEYTNRQDCINNGCYWYNGSCHDDIVCSDINNSFDCQSNDCDWWYESGGCHMTPELYPNLCIWVMNHGTATGIRISEVFEIVDSYIYNVPPPDSSFIPTLTEVMGILDYYLGFYNSGNINAGCNFYSFVKNMNLLANVIASSGIMYNNKFYFLAKSPNYDMKLYIWDGSTLAYTSAFPLDLRESVYNNRTKYLPVNENEVWFVYIDFVNKQTGVRKYNINTWVLEAEVITGTGTNNLYWRCQDIIKLSSGNILVLTTYDDWSATRYPKFTLLNSAGDIIDEINGSLVSERVYGSLNNPMKQYSNGDIYSIIGADGRTSFNKIVLRETSGELQIISENFSWLFGYELLREPEGEYPYPYLFDHYIAYQNGNWVLYSSEPFVKATQISIIDVLTETLQMHTMPPDLCERVSPHVDGLTNGKFWSAFTSVTNENFENKLYLFIQNGSSYIAEYLLQLKHWLNPGQMECTGAGDYIAATDINGELYVIQVTP